MSLIESQRQPASQRAEESVIGTLMRSEQARMEILQGKLEAEHLYFRPYRLAYEAIQERYYSDDPIDPLTIAEMIGPRAADAWGISEREAVDKIVELAKPDPADTASVREHAEIIKRHSQFRDLVTICSTSLSDAIEQDRDPEEIAGELGTAVTRVITGAMMNSEMLSYGELGARWYRAQMEEIAARAAGMELGAFFGIPGIDSFVKGLRGSELMILGGDPGVGKTAIVMAMLRNFAKRQMRKPTERRVGTLYLSLEMGEKQSGDRWAQMESRVQGEALRMGTITQAELREIGQKWAANRDLPIIVNHSGELRQSQIRALCVDAIRRHQVGLVVIDHFRLIKTDEKFRDKNEADDEIVKFLKSTLAKDLNLAVICLAHTTKGESGERPRMDDLRGSKMISAFADVVAFPYSPWAHATQNDRDQGRVAREDIEMIFDKVRASAKGTGEIYTDLSTMSVR